MTNTTLGWGTAAPHWSEVMKLLFWASLTVLSLIAALLPTSTAIGSAWANPDQADPQSPYSVDQSGSLVSTVDIGGAQIKSNVLSDLPQAPGVPLTLGRRQISPTISPVATDGVHLPTAAAGLTVLMYLPNERELSAADWDPEGVAKFSCCGTDYRISSAAGGRTDVTITRYEMVGPEDLTFRLRIPEDTHMRMAGDTWLIEREAVAGGAPTSIATVSTRATNDKGVIVPVATEIYSDFRFRQLNLRLRVMDQDALSLPMTIQLTYKAGE